MFEKIVQLNEEALKGQFKELVRGSVVSDDLSIGFIIDYSIECACWTGISFTAAGGCIEMHHRVFGEQIAVGIELEIVAGFVK